MDNLTSILESKPDISEHNGGTKLAYCNDIYRPYVISYHRLFKLEKTSFKDGVRLLNGHSSKVTEILIPEDADTVGKWHILYWTSSSCE